jgi:hypothetical protein
MSVPRTKAPTLKPRKYLIQIAQICALYLLTIIFGAASGYGGVTAALVLILRQAARKAIMVGTQLPTTSKATTTSKANRHDHNSQQSSKTQGKPKRNANAQIH